MYKLSETHLEETETFLIKGSTFKLMTEQVAGGSFNWQHGATYLSPSKKTAVAYATNKRYGSELLTYTIDFLQLLVDKKIKCVTTDLYRKYQKIFGLLEAHPLPSLVQVSNVPVSSLMSEHGESSEDNIAQMQEVLTASPILYEVYLQQTNFRLREPIPMGKLKLWFINVQKWDAFRPEYNLYQIIPNDA